jgi:hypothetical protein
LIPSVFDPEQRPELLGIIGEYLIRSGGSASTNLLDMIEHVLTQLSEDPRSLETLDAVMVKLFAVFDVTRMLATQERPDDSFLSEIFQAALIELNLRVSFEL